MPLVAQSLPENMGAGLRQLIQAYRAGSIHPSELRRARLAFNPRTGRQELLHNARIHMIVDTQNRVMARIVLDGSVPMERMREELRRLGVAIVADDPNYRRGAAEAYIPLDAAETIARMPGVAAMHLVRSPLHHVGAVTTQGAAILHSDQVNSNGITGNGITVGILSDSYNLDAEPDPFLSLFGPVITATDDVNTGDLPNFGVPDGRPGLKFLEEGPDGGQDEGRGMAQIVYDMAPSTSLCFASAEVGEFGFATNIRRLRTDSQCAADIIVDDTLYLGEPAFSDGILAQAVNDVVTSGALAGKPVTYFSAAGNSAGSVYFSDFRAIADGDARALSGQPIDLTTIPPGIDTSGGFHNFNSDPNGAPILTQSVAISALSTDQSELVLQWDDPFDTPKGITTDLNLLIFDSTGKYVSQLSSTDNNFQTLEPIEGTLIQGGLKFRVAITRTGKSSTLPRKIFLLEFSQGVLTGDFLDISAPAIWGHAGAKNAITVAAYTYDNGMVADQYSPELESYSSSGPVTICCDAGGARLSSPEVRQKPEVSGVDGVSTTFFAFPDFTDPFFSFPGTSAAAPHVAGIAALMLEAAGGPGSLTADQIRSRLIASTGTHDLDPFSSQAVLGDGNVVVKLSAHGGDNQGGPFGPSSLTDAKFFNLQFTSPNSGQTLTALTIDLSSTALFFNINARTGFRLTTGASSQGVAVTSSVTGAGSTLLTLNVTGLQPGGFVQFGIGRAQQSTRQNGYSADLLAGAKVTATLSNPSATFTGTIVNKTGTGYTPADGWGLVDASKALQAR